MAQISDLETWKIPPHQQRVISEKKDLDLKAHALAAFFRNKIFWSLHPDERARLKRQLGVMNEYSAILGELIAAF